MTHVTLECPYCDAKFKVTLETKSQGHSLRGIACMPYTRDIGRFDDGQWRRVGADFFSNVLAWEEVGILRVPRGSDINVWYRVATCPQCERLFDSYADFSGDHGMDEFWPHLFGKDGNGALRPYNGHTATTALLARLTGLISSSWVGAVLLALGLTIIALVPQVISWALGGFAGTFLSTVSIAFHALGILVLTLLFVEFDRYVGLMHRREGFYDLLDVRKRDHTTFWTNYTLARFVGVQSPGKRPRITQVAVLAGIPSATALWLSWFAFQLGQTGRDPVISFFTAIVCFLSGYLIASLVRRQSPSDGMRSRFFPVNGERLRGGIIGLALWIAAALLQLTFMLSWQTVLTSLSDLLFWTIVAFYVGIGIHFAFNTSTYVMRGVSHLPMRLSPLRHYRELESLERLGNLSFGALANVLLLLIPLIIAFSVPWPDAIRHELDGLWWVFLWADIGVALLFAVLGVAISRGMLAASVSYLVVSYLLPAMVGALVLPCQPASAQTLCTIQLPVLATRLLVGNDTILLYPKLLLLGVFLSLVVYVQVNGVNVILCGVKEVYRRREVDRLETKIEEIREMMLAWRPGDNDALFAQTDSLSRLLELRDYVEGQSVEMSLTRRIVRIASPLLSTIVVPIMLRVFLP